MERVVVRLKGYASGKPIKPGKERAIDSIGALYSTCTLYLYLVYITVYSYQVSSHRVHSMPHELSQKTGFLSIDVITRVGSALIKCTVRTSRRRWCRFMQRSGGGGAICVARLSGAHQLPPVRKGRRTKVLNSKVSTLCVVCCHGESAIYEANKLYLLYL